MAPIEASKKENIEIVHNNLFPKNDEVIIKKPKYKIGDTVRRVNFSKNDDRICCCREV